MTKQAQTTPNAISDESLDEISGGPHFRNFHGTSFDFQAMPELDANVADEAKAKVIYDTSRNLEPNKPA